jgi:hypothetical protein
VLLVPSHVHATILPPPVGNVRDDAGSAAPPVVAQPGLPAAVAATAMPTVRHAPAAAALAVVDEA